MNDLLNKCKNIKPIILKLRNNEKILIDENNQIVNFYVEILSFLNNYQI
jgi:hypothetical protein